FTTGWQDKIQVVAAPLACSGHNGQIAGGGGQHDQSGQVTTTIHRCMTDLLVQGFRTAGLHDGLVCRAECRKHLLYPVARPLRLYTGADVMSSGDDYPASIEFLGPPMHFDDRERAVLGAGMHLDSAASAFRGNE